MPFLSSGVYSTVTSLGSVIADMVAALTKLGQGTFAPPTTALTLVNGANTNVVLPATSRMRIAGPTGAFSISGFAGGVDGMRIWIYNPLSQTMTITNNATSTAANRILTNNNGADIVLQAGSSSLVVMSYDGTDLRWIVESVINLNRGTAPITKTGNYSQTGFEQTIIFNGSASITFTLLSAASVPGLRVRVVTIAAQPVVSNASNVVPLTGGSAGTAILSGTAGKWADLESDGTNWVITAAV